MPGIQELRDYQRAGSDLIVDFFSTAAPGDRLMLVAPTGSGKSYVQTAALRRVPGLAQVVPSVEIAAGLYEKLTGDSVSGLSEAKLRGKTEGRNIFTSKRLLNLLLDAKIPLPKYLAFDESHHTTDDTHTTLHAITGMVPAVGLTATPYRGTPKETKKLHDSWPVRKTLLSLSDAVARGIISQPTFSTWPLLNDDLIDVSNGEFKVTSIDSHLKSKLEDLIDRVATFWNEDRDCGAWDRPTMIAVSSKAAVEMVVKALGDRKLPAVGITEKSTRKERDDAFRDTIDCCTILVQINVVSEGVDLPIRRLIDLAPTMSPVRWVQRLGRIKRPVGLGELPPEYIACCHNITRHGYLEADVLPPTAFLDAQKAWGEKYKPTRKSLARAIGFDGFGRFQVATVPLASGLLVSLYALQTKNGLAQYAVVLRPDKPDPYYFVKHNVLTGETGTFTKPDGTVIQFNKKTYGPWERIAGLPELTGCVSIPEDRFTENMLNKWKELAGRYGLDADFAPDGRTFQILPICWNTKTRFDR